MLLGRILFYIVRLIWVRRGFGRAIWSGIAVGVFVGVIVALARDDWWMLLYSCLAGLFVGLIAELVILLIDRTDN
jgi:Na+/H+-dicarboxylate symporter